jgi:hypothetical protein
MDEMYQAPVKDRHQMDTGPKNEESYGSEVIEKNGAPGKSRTCDLLVRRLRLQNPNCLIVSCLRTPVTLKTAPVGLQMGHGFQLKGIKNLF